ncbi:trypsin I-P1-like [Plectropomus leopardus]|uniref:trypsin I-P1-like n=1 Tax=Plectropomus leopardus TaxID=160734 RepID=UPI001C4D59C3|nr:trypsin I-P1-like [Plectropomus leopardus]
MGGITRLLLLLWVGVTVSTVVDLQKRIIGGQECRQDEGHYHVRLTERPGTKEPLCGGSLISDRWILTAAHCYEPGRTIYATLGVHPGPGKEVKITDDPVIFTDGDGRRHDIMLLKLPKKTDITPIKLPDCEHTPQVDYLVQMAGHGPTQMGSNSERGNDISDTLQCANIKVVDCQQLRNCLESNDPQFYADIEYQHWFCGQMPNVDISPGDSGGGVVFNGRIYGVIAIGGNYTHACVEAAGFMNVCEYMDWIEKNSGGLLTKLRHKMKSLVFWG